MFSCTLKPYCRLDTNNPYPILSHWVFPNKWYPILDQTSLSKTLFRTKLLENHTLHSGTYPYSLNDGNPLPPTPRYCIQLGVALIAGRCPSDFRQVAVTKFVFCRHKRVTMMQKYVDMYQTQIMTLFTHNLRVLWTYAQEHVTSPPLWLHF